MCRNMCLGVGLEASEVQRLLLSLRGSLVRSNVNAGPVLRPGFTVTVSPEVE
jgi:hypothetical protein